MNRLQVCSHGQEMLVEVPRRVGRDLRSFTPTLFTPRLDGLADGDSMPRKEVWTGEDQNQKTEADSCSSRRPFQRKRGYRHYCRMLLTRHYDQRTFDETVCDAIIANGGVKTVKKGAKRLRWKMHQTRFKF